MKDMKFLIQAIKKALLIAKEQLNKIKSNYRWICSGTPYGTLADFKNIINYITNLEYSTLQRHNYNMFLDKLFRKNTKESVKQEVNIPQPIVSTEFLNMSQLERLIYDSALNNPNKQIELCNHIMVSEEHLNILGNKPLSLEEIKEKMTDYYNNKIETYKKRIEKKITLIETLENQDNPNSDKIIDEKTKLDDYKLKLQDYTSKYNIFTNIEEKISDDDTCPICLEELKDLNSSITPYGHIFCSSCLNESNNHSHKNKCPMCRYSFKIEEVKTIKPDNNNNDSNNEPKLGTKISCLIDNIKNIINNNNKDKIIVFSQWDNMLKLISKIFEENNINFIFINGSIHTSHQKLENLNLIHPLMLY